MLDLLPVLRERGHRLGIVTAKRRVTAELAFQRFPVLRELTELLIGADDTERHKPDPEPLLEALSRLGARPGEAAYVGDSPFDVRAAKAGGLLAVAVGWGGIHADDDSSRGGAGRARSTSPGSCSMSSERPAPPSSAG